MGWIIGIFVTLYALLFIVWFYVGYHSGDVVNNITKIVKSEAIKFLKSPNQMKKGN